MKSVLILGAAAALLASCTAQSKKENSSAEIQKPNVIFLVADDIGFGDFSCNGATEISTPNVDKLASQGVRFTDAHAVAATSTPSRYSLFTGHYAWRRNDTGIAAGNAGMVIRPEQPTVADMFSRVVMRRVQLANGIWAWQIRRVNRIGMVSLHRDQKILGLNILILWQQRAIVFRVVGWRINGLSIWIRMIRLK